jgi:hypothetical protein
VDAEGSKKPISDGFREDAAEQDMFLCVRDVPAWGGHASVRQVFAWADDVIVGPRAEPGGVGGIEAMSGCQLAYA